MVVKSFDQRQLSACVRLCGGFAVHGDGVDVLADVRLGELFEAFRAEALRFVAVRAATAEDGRKVVAPAASGGAAAAFKFSGAAWAGFVHSGWFQCHNWGNFSSDSLYL